MSRHTDTRAGKPSAPDSEEPRKADSLGELSKRSWKYVFVKTAREFVSDQCTDIAAALTYFAVLSIVISKPERPLAIETADRAIPSHPGEPGTGCRERRLVDSGSAGSLILWVKDGAGNLSRVSESV